MTERSVTAAAAAVGVVEANSLLSCLVHLPSILFLVGETLPPLCRCKGEKMEYSLACVSGDAWAPT